MVDSWVAQTMGVLEFVEVEVEVELEEVLGSLNGQVGSERLPVC